MSNSRYHTVSKYWPVEICFNKTRQHEAVALWGGGKTGKSSEAKHRRHSALPECPGTAMEAGEDTKAMWIPHTGSSPWGPIPPPISPSHLPPPPLHQHCECHSLVLNNSYVSGLSPTTFHGLSHSFLTIALWRRHCYHSHFADEKGGL